MPLTERVSFKAMLKKKNLVQIPKLIRWQHKLEPSQILKVTVSVAEALCAKESFLGTMHKDGRIHFPKLQLALLKQNSENLERHALEITLEPT